MSRFLAALNNQNQGRPPVWLMRQAGRYLPEYKQLRKNHSLLEMFLSPDLIAEVTLMPIKRFDMDASILFSDILMVARGMGLNLDFEEGPKVTPSIDSENWKSFQWDLDPLTPVFEGIAKIKARSSTPLIGFCGGPFTVSTYLIPPEIRQNWMREDAQSFTAFLDRLTEHSIAYLQAQVAAGVDAIQVFDSWASLLNEKEWEKWSLAPLKKMIQALNIPAIVFMRGSGRRAEKIAEIRPAAISLDWECRLKEIRQKVYLPLQGNLDPSLLLRPVDEVREEVHKILEEMQGDPGFIFNLGHGVLPTTSVNAVQALVNAVKNIANN